MKPIRERPSVWHIIVTLAAMSYLWCASKAVMSMVNFSGGLDQRLTAVVFGFLIIFAWCFLIRDLIRQILRFFQRENHEPHHPPRR